MSDRFNELLPWYVNGTLDDADRTWMEQHLAAHAEAREELAWFRSLQAQMRQDAPAVPQSIGLARTLRLIRGDRPTLAERFSGFFAALGMRPGLALAGLALMAVQGGVIHHLLQAGRDDSLEFRALGASGGASTGRLLEIRFAAGAREVDIRLALVSVQGSLAAGPGPQGDYLVRVPAGTEAASAEQLKANAVVRSVRLAALPGRP
jgi:anti-sigma factor RsiW